MEFFKNTSAIGFMQGRKLAYLVSTILFVVSIGALVFKGLNLGVDFTGGVTIEAKFTQQAQPETLRRSFEAAGFEDVQVQNFGSSRDVAIRLPPPSGETADAIRSRVETILRAADANVVISRAEIVGPQVGAELRNSAIVALISTLILIFIYVFLRFHAWQLSAGAILAAIHDPIIVLGFFALTGMVFDLSVVAALLAVIGYSLNDTVVVFDRIRERFEVNKRMESFMVLDQSVDMVDQLRRIAAFFRDESCGQCVPCRVGTVRQEEIVSRLAKGVQSQDIELLRELGTVMRDASICGLGQTANSAIDSAINKLKVFAV